MALTTALHRKREQLSNGLVLLVSENQRLPLLSINAFVRAGADQNPPQRPGLSSLTASLLDEGTEKYDTHQIAAMIEDTGGAMSVFSQRELSGINMEMKSEDLELALDLMAEMLCRPNFPRDRFVLEQEKVLNHLESMADTPQLVAGNLFNRCIYRDSPFEFPILGTEESILDLRVEELGAFHRQHFGPQNTILVIVGAMDSTYACELIDRRFSSWLSPQLKPAQVPGLERQAAPIVEERFMDKEQIHVLLGHLGIQRTNPDYYALQIMDVILGSGPGFTSRIPRKLRDEQGLAYSTYADISNSSGIYPGRFIAYISTSPENREQAMGGLIAEIKEVVHHGITADELETAQHYLTGNFVFDFQSNGNIARFLLNTELFGLGIDFPQTYPQIIRKITRDEVQRVARQYLDTINYTTVIVGPRS